MPREFEIRREGFLPGAPQQVFDALTTGSGGWLWPLEYEPREGGRGPWGGRVLAWDPPHRLVVRSEGPDGWFNQLDNEIQRAEGGAILRYVHSGVFTDDWDQQYDGADKHTDFYLHTLGQYLGHFTDRAPSYAGAQGPASSAAPGSFATLIAAMGLRDAAEGDRVRVDPDGAGTADAVVDYRNEWFLGLRSDDALHRVFGRDAFGHPVAVAVHRFGGGADEIAARWQSLIDRTYS